MKKLRNVLLLVMVLPLCSTIELMAQKKEIPINTTSKEAMKLYLDGVDKLENGEYVKAIPLFEKAIEKDAGFAMAYLYRAFSGGNADVFKQNMDKAVKLSENVSEGEKLEILYYKAMADGTSVKQKEYLDKLLELFPSDKRVQLDAGLYFYGRNDYSNALIHLTKATELNKNYAVAFNLIGYCQSALNNYSEAEKAFQTYIKLKPKNANPYDSYAELLLKMGKYDESIVQYKKALEKDPNFSASLNGIGHNYIFKGNYETARKYYRECFDKAPDMGTKFNSMYWKAVSYLHEGNIENALKIYDEYRALAEKDNLVQNIIDSYSTQAWILDETGDPEEGYTFTKKAVALINDPKLSEIEKETYQTYKLLWDFGHFIDIGEFDKAHVESGKCEQKLESRKNPGEDMWYNYLVGYMENKIGNYDKALEFLSNANQESPGTWYQTALVYKNKGDMQSASKMFEKIVNYNVNSINLAFVRKKAISDLANK